MIASLPSGDSAEIAMAENATAASAGTAPPLQDGDGGLDEGAVFGRKMTEADREFLDSLQKAPQWSTWSSPASGIDEQYWFMGSYWPPGVESWDHVRSEVDDFPQDLLNQFDLTDLPVNHSHDYAMTLGRVVANGVGPSGRGYLVGYVDGSTEEGRKAVENMFAGQWGELSLAHRLDYNGRDQIDDKQLLGDHVSIVEKGEKPGCKILGMCAGPRATARRSTAPDSGAPVLISSSRAASAGEFGGAVDVYLATLRDVVGGRCGGQTPPFATEGVEGKSSSPSSSHSSLDDSTADAETAVDGFANEKKTTPDAQLDSGEQKDPLQQTIQSAPQTLAEEFPLEQQQVPDEEMQASGTSSFPAAASVPPILAPHIPPKPMRTDPTRVGSGAAALAPPSGAAAAGVVPAEALANSSNGNGSNGESSGDSSSPTGGSSSAGGGIDQDGEVDSEEDIHALASRVAQENIQVKTDLVETDKERKRLEVEEQKLKVRVQELEERLKQAEASRDMDVSEKVETFDKVVLSNIAPEERRDAVAALRSMLRSEDPMVSNAARTLFSATRAASQATAQSPEYLEKRAQEAAAQRKRSQQDADHAAREALKRAKNFSPGTAPTSLSASTTRSSQSSSSAHNSATGSHSSSSSAHAGASGQNNENGATSLADLLSHYIKPLGIPRRLN